jgi:Tol biopolymer transport system component
MTDRPDELGNALRTLLAEETAAMAIDPVAGAQRLEREIAQVQRRRRIATIVATAAVVVVALGGAALWNAHSNERSVGVANRDKPTQVAGSFYFLDLDTGTRTPTDTFDPDNGYAFSPDGRKVVCYGRCFGESGLVVADADGSQPVKLHMPLGVDANGDRVTAETHEIVWSPDGTKLLYQLDDGTHTNIGNLILHDVATDKAMRVTDFPLDEVFYYQTSFDFSPDGQTVIYHLPDSRGKLPGWDLWSQPLSGGEPTLVLRDAALPVYLSDGHSLAFVEPAPHIYGVYGSVVDIATDGSRRTLAPIGRDTYVLRPSPDRSRLLGIGRDGVYVIDVATGESSHLFANTASWAGGHSLLVGCIPTAPAPDEEPTVDNCS